MSENPGARYETQPEPWERDLLNAERRAALRTLADKVGSQGGWLRTSGLKGTTLGPMSSEVADGLYGIATALPEALDALDRVAALHVRINDDHGNLCAECGDTTDPCATVRALEGAS